MKSETLTDVVHAVAAGALGGQGALQDGAVQQLHRQHEHRLAGHVVLPAGLLEPELGEHLRHPDLLLLILVRERSFMTSTATWGPGGQAKSD